MAKAIFGKALPNSIRGSIRCSSIRTLQRKRSHRQTGCSNTGHVHHQNRYEVNSLSPVNIVTDPASLTHSSRNLLQQIASNGTHVVHLKQSSTTPPILTKPANATLLNSQNLPYWHIYLSTDYVSMQYQAVIADFRETSIGFLDCKCNLWA